MLADLTFIPLIFLNIRSKFQLESCFLQGGVAKNLFFEFLYHSLNESYCSSDFQPHSPIIGECVTQKTQKLAHFGPQFS